MSLQRFIVSEIVEKKKRGRPPGFKAAQRELKTYLLNLPDTEKVIDVILEAALDKNHKHQAAAWKLILDRICPTSQFEKFNGRETVQINISSVETPKIVAEQSNDDDVTH